MRRNGYNQVLETAGVKLAVNLEQLRKATTALKKRVPIHRRDITMTGDVLPKSTVDETGKSLRGNAARDFRYGDMGAVGPVASVPERPHTYERLVNEAVKYAPPGPEMLAQVPARFRPAAATLERDARHAVYDNIRAERASARKLRSEGHPRIFVGKDQPVNALKTLTGNDSRMNRLVDGLTPAGREAANRSVWLHEGAEAGKHFGNRGFASHISTRPMLQDLNIAATLKGEGAEAGNVFRMMREPEVEALNSVVPGVDRLQLGQKRISRHAQKRLQEAYERNIERMAKETGDAPWDIMMGAFPR